MYRPTDTHLQTKCRAYCDSVDPYAALTIGKLSLTKIKDAFAIFKNLVLESRAAALAAGGSGGGRKMLDGGGDEGHVSADASKQIKDLKSLLLQRDNEIAILVSMVKKGKTMDDVRSSSGATSRSGPAQARMDDDDDDASESHTVSTQRRHEASAKEQAAAKAAHRQHADYQQTLAMQQQQREAAREEKILKRHLFGVPPPADQATFDDAAASFEWFRERCSLNASMEENRDVLKNKITEAKTLGERVNQSRATISYLKNSIEAIRREQALRRIDTGDEGKGGGNDDTAAAAHAESPEEQTYRRAIEQEKAVYKEGFERLRVLKPEIEHVRKIMEKCRLAMQGQFDQWYSNLHARGGMVGAFSGLAGAHGGVSGDRHGHGDGDGGYGGHGDGPHKPGSAAHGTRGGYDDDPYRGDEHKDVAGSSSAGHRSGRDARDHMRRSHSGPALPGTGAAAPSAASPGSHVSQRKREQATAVDTSASASSDVNEDIMAFYQAKEEMLRRRGQGAGGQAAR